MKRFLPLICWLGLVLLAGCKTAPPVEGESDPLWPVREEVFSGIRILHIATPKEVVSVQLFIDGGAANYRKGKEGIDRLALETATFGGAGNFSAAEVASRIDSLGFKVGTASTLDYSVISVTFLREHFDPAWELFAAVVQNPTFDNGEFERIRERELSALKQGATDPQWVLARSSREKAFKELPYSRHPDGNPNTLAELTVREAKAYFKTMVTKNNMVLVVSGPVEVDRIVDKLLFGMDGLPDGAELVNTDTVVTLEPKLSLINHPGYLQQVQATCAGPAAGSGEEPAFQVAMALLRDHFQRTLAGQQATLPDIAVQFTTTGQNFGWIRFSCKDPNKAAKSVNEELRSLLTSGFPETLVEQQKKTLKTAWLQDREGAYALAAHFGAAAVKSGPPEGGWKAELTFLRRLDALDKTTVDTAFFKWCRNWHWTVMGDETLPRPANFLMPME